MYCNPTNSKPALIYANLQRHKISGKIKAKKYAYDLRNGLYDSNCFNISKYIENR